MGNQNIFSLSSKNKNFIDQLKVDEYKSLKIVGIFINPGEFTKSGLIVITTKEIINYCPLNGKIIGIFNSPGAITQSCYNRKSKEGSIVCIICEDNRIFLINSENLTIIKTLYFNNNSNLHINQHSKITSLNFELPDTLFFGFSDASIIKFKFNEEPLNLKFDNQNKNISVSTEDEFDNIKCIFSTDRLIQNYEGYTEENANYDYLTANYYNINNEVLINGEQNEDKSFLTKSSDLSGSSFSKNSLNNSKIQEEKKNEIYIYDNNKKVNNNLDNNDRMVLDESQKITGDYKNKKDNKENQDFSKKSQTNKNKINKNKNAKIKNFPGQKASDSNNTSDTILNNILTNQINQNNSGQNYSSNFNKIMDSSGTLEKPNFQLINYSKNLEGGYSNAFYGESCEFLLLSNRYKILFCIHKLPGGSNKINLYCLRNNNLLRTFCKIDSVNITSAKILDKKDLILLVAFFIETKETHLLIYSFSDSYCPIAKFKISDFLDYSYTIRAVNTTSLPTRYYGRNSNHGVMDGDLVIFGTTKGDIIFGKIQNNNFTGNNKPRFEVMHIYKLKNKLSQGHEISNNFEISYILYDLFFDIMIIGDYSSNVRVIEKVLQIGKSNSVEENLPFFSLFYEANKFPKKNILNENFNHDLPLISITHDVLKDRSIIMFDQGKDLVIETNDEEEDDQ